MDDNSCKQMHRRLSSYINSHWHGSTKGSYCFALWQGRSGHLGNLGCFGCHTLPHILVAINIKPLKLKTCLVHKLAHISNGSLLLFDANKATEVLKNSIFCGNSSKATKRIFVKLIMWIDSVF